MTITIDGAAGEGGGQILRTALSLSMCTGQDIAIVNIRAGRKRSGLMRQHLAALRASAEVCNATISGDELGSSQMRFAPGKIRPGRYRFAIGSAGSTTLLFQTLLPALLVGEAASDITLEGGTHNPLAPSVDFVSQAFLSTLAPTGIQVDIELQRHGFYPNGGGAWQAHVAPWRERHALSAIERGTLIERCAVAIIAGGVESHVAVRELDRVRRKLQFADHELSVNRVESVGPGNLLSLRLRYSHASELCEEAGAIGVSAERVAGRAVAKLRGYLQGNYAIGEYLADQLLLPMALGAGGEFSCAPLTAHTRTNIQVIEQLLGKTCVTVTEGEGGCHVEVRT